MVWFSLSRGIQDDRLSLNFTRTSKIMTEKDIQQHKLKYKKAKMELIERNGGKDKIKSDFKFIKLI